MTDDAAESVTASDDDDEQPTRPSESTAETASTTDATDVSPATDAADPDPNPNADAGHESSGVIDSARALASGTRFGKFASVGVVGAAFDVTTATALQSLGVFPELAVFVGIEVAVIVMFVLNDNWTFSTEGHRSVGATLRRLLRSNLVRAGGITVQLLTFRLLYRVFFLDLGVLGIDAWFVAAKVTGIGSGLVVNYVAESLFTWRVHE